MEIELIGVRLMDNSLSGEVSYHAYGKKMWPNIKSGLGQSVMQRESSRFGNILLYISETICWKCGVKHLLNHELIALGRQTVKYINNQQVKLCIFGALIGWFIIHE